MTSVTSVQSGSAADQTCPYLGLVGDPASHFAFPSSAQSCHAGRRPVPLATAKQARDCLTARHVACPRYRPPAAPAPSAEIHQILAAAVTTRAVHPEGDTAAARRGTPRLRGAAIVLGLFVGSIVLGLLFGSWLASGTGRPPQPAAGPSAAQPAASQTLIASPSAPATEPPPSTGQSPSQSPIATPSASPSPSGPLIHVVEPNESLTLIAKRYGVTVQAIQDANAIEDPNVIFVGQRLVIPGP